MSFKLELLPKSLLGSLCLNSELELLLIPNLEQEGVGGGGEFDPELELSLKLHFRSLCLTPKLELF